MTNRLHPIALFLLCLVGLFAVGDFSRMIGGCTPAQRQFAERVVLEEAKILCAIKRCDEGIAEAVLVANACGIAEIDAQNVINTRKAILAGDAGAL